MPTIASISATPINVPMVAPYRFSFGLLHSFTSTIVEVTDDDGVTGIGESPHGDLTVAVEGLADRLIGLDVEALNEAESRCVSRTGFSAWSEDAVQRRAFGAVELALWDLRARRAGVPLADLLGGRLRDKVPFTEFFALRAGREETPAQLVEYCLAMAAEHGSTMFEGKLGVLPVEAELEWTARLVRELRPSLVRLDANGAYTVPTARRVCRSLEELGISWLEDPCRTLDETARLREGGTAVSFSTHEVDLPRAARTGVPDAFCVDIAELGGLRRTQDFLRACAALGTDFWCYSGDGGVLTAAYLHLTAAEPSMIRPHQSLFRATGDVVIEQGPYAPKNDLLPVPEGPGLGVTLDRAAMARLNERYRREGPMGATIGADYGRAFRQQ